MMSPENQLKLDVARDELKTVEAELRAARKILNRDWEALSPRERSSQSRVVKDLEEREHVLRETIESLVDCEIEYSNFLMSWRIKVFIEQTDRFPRTV